MASQTTAAAARQTAAQTVRDHHERLVRTLNDHAVTIRRAVDRLSAPAAVQKKLVAFCTEEVLPHAAAEEETLYKAAAELPEARLLVQAMSREHASLRELVADVESARTAGEAAAAAGALDALFSAHVEKENDLLLPVLLDAGVDLSAMLEGMHERLGAEDQGSCCGHACACGGHGDPDATAEAVDGELDVRPLPPAQRHERIFATFAALAPGTAFVLVNDHDPKPLRYQFAAEHPGEYTWDYLESGPRVWRVRIGRP